MRGRSPGHFAIPEPRMRSSMKKARVLERTGPFRSYRKISPRRQPGTGRRRSLCNRLVCVLGLTALCHSISVCIELSLPEREKEDRTDSLKNVQTTPICTYCKGNRPLPYYYQISKTPRHWKFIQHHRTFRPLPLRKRPSSTSGLADLCPTKERCLLQPCSGSA